MTEFETSYKRVMSNFGIVHGTFFSDAYVRSVDGAIQKAFSAMKEEADRIRNVSSDYAKGNFFETWHAETLNISAAARGRSDIYARALSNNKPGQDVEFGVEGDVRHAEMKCYKNGSDTAKAISDPAYMGSDKVVPKDQLPEVGNVAQHLADKNLGKREEMVESYQDTADRASDRLHYDNAESRPLSEGQAREYRGKLNDQEETAPADLGLTTESFIKLSDIGREAQTAALHAAAISAAIVAAPYVTKAIAEQLKTGRIDADMLAKGGEAIVMAAGNAGMRAGIAATIVGCCKAGHAGETLKELSPEVIGISTAMAINAIGYSVQCARGTLTQRELALRCMADVSAMSAGFVGITLGQALIPLPLLGGLIGNMVGSLIGASLFHGAQGVTLGLCVESGWTCFGLVEQDYRVPEEVLRQCGFDLIPIERIQPPSFTVRSFKPSTVSVPEVSITHLRRGVIGMTSVGYV